MPLALHTVGLMTQSEALRAVLTMVIAADPRLRVRAFASLDDVAIYAGIAPVGVLVVDLDDDRRLCEALAAEFGGSLEQTQILALTSHVDGGLKARSHRAGIAEVIVKPSSPRHLRERIRARLGAAPPVPHLGITTRYTGNVVELFPQRALV